MLNRWWSLKTESDTKERRRPYLASKCNSIVACEKWRLQILREIGKKVTEIQNASLGEHKIRDLNDEINKLIREKGHWEKRILELGGPNYMTSNVDVGTDAGIEAPGEQRGGYKYFGAARELKGVKELFHQPVEKKKKTRQELYKAVTADYYGFRDDEDGKLVLLEQEAEKLAREKDITSWREQYTVDTKASALLCNLVVPSPEQIEKELIERRKKDLLQKYVT